MVITFTVLAVIYFEVCHDLQYRDVVCMRALTEFSDTNVPREMTRAAIIN